MLIRLLLVSLTIPLIIILIPITTAQIYSNTEINIQYDGSLPPNINKYLGKPLSYSEFLFLNENSIIERILMNHPLIKKIEIVRVFPASIHVQGFAREIITCFKYNNEIYLLDSEGTILSKVSNVYPGVSEIVISSAFPFNENKITSIIRSMYLIERTEENFLNNINKLHFLNQEELIITFNNGCQAMVYLAELADKLTIISQLFPLHNHEYILDFTIDKQVIIRKIGNNQ